MQALSKQAQHLAARAAVLGPFLPLGLVLLLVTLQCLQAAPYPQDDLLRNVAAYAWGFDYSALYPYSPGVPHFDPYIGFDWLLGQVSRAFGTRSAVVVAQLAGAAAFAVALLAPLRVTEDRIFRATAAIVLVMGTLVTSRLVGGRPEIWATVWLLSAASLPPRAWLLLGALLSPAYWLMPLYSLGALMLSGTWRRRLSLLVLAVAATSAFWLVYAGREWVETGLALPSLNHRPVQAVEAGPLLGLLNYPGTWLMLASLAGTILGHRGRLQHWRLALPFIGFLAIGSVRHILVLAPLAGLWIALQSWRRPGLTAWSALTFVALIAGALGTTQMPGHLGPQLQVPRGSVILSGYNPAVFYLPFHNAGTFSMAPSIESGWDTPQVVALARAVTSGTLTCDSLNGTSFTHVLAQADKPLSGPCFTLYAKEPGWTLWERAQPVKR
jgi:hypothetical protein